MRSGSAAQEPHRTSVAAPVAKSDIPGPRRPVPQPAGDGTHVGAPRAEAPTGTQAAEVLSAGKPEAEAERRPADWQNFAPQPPRPAGVLARVAGRIGRPVRHEWTLTILSGFLLSAGLNYQVLRDPLHTLPQDATHPSVLAFRVLWTGHTLLHSPGEPWQFNGGADGLAHRDPYMGYAPLRLLGAGPGAAVLQYNIIFIVAQALCFIGAYALVRQLGAARMAAALAGVAFAAAPWRLGQSVDMQILSAGGIVLALAMLARGHGVRWRRWSGRANEDEALSAQRSERPRKRPGWAIAGWLCATWQVSLGFGIGLIFAYVLLGMIIAAIFWWLIRSRRLPSRGLLVADLIGGLIFAGVCLFLALPYLTAVTDDPNVASDQIGVLSPTLRGLFTAPEQSLIWGDLHAPARALLDGQMTLLPGFALLAFAAAGVGFSIWRPTVRLALLAGVVLSAALALGTHGPADGRAGYLWLRNLPLVDSLPTPGRLIIWTTLLLALLAAGSVSALADRAGDVALRLGFPRPTTMARVALLLPVVLVLAEGLGTTPRESVPAAPSTALVTTATHHQ